jgi:hypothetical protein
LKTPVEKRPRLIAATPAICARLGLAPEPTPPAAARAAVEAGTARRRRYDAQRAERLALLALLRECGSPVFDGPPRPLAIGIHAQIIDLVGDAAAPRAIGELLRRWTSSPDYLWALANGEPRRHLDGSLAGLPDPAHRIEASNRLIEQKAAATAADQAAGKRRNSSEQDRQA